MIESAVLGQLLLSPIQTLKRVFSNYNNFVLFFCLLVFCCFVCVFVFRFCRFTGVPAVDGVAHPTAAHEAQRRAGRRRSSKRRRVSGQSETRHDHVFQEVVGKYSAGGIVTIALYRQYSANADELFLAYLFFLFFFVFFCGWVRWHARCAAKYVSRGFVWRGGSIFAGTTSYCNPSFSPWVFASFFSFFFLGKFVESFVFLIDTVALWDVRCV